MNEIQQTLMFNPVAWVIVLLALAVYTQLFKLWLLMPPGKVWANLVCTSRRSLKVLMSALPLLGLLGTINGLMTTFSALSFNVAADLETLMASGISDAMITTQLGLAFVVPALVLYAALEKRYRRYQDQ